MIEERRCKATKADGTPCGTRPEMVRDSGYCDSHDPSPAKREALRKRSQKGGIRAQQKLAKPGVKNLPPLRELADAEKWMEMIGVAAAKGTIDDRDAGSAIKACQTFVNARKTKNADDMIKKLEKALGAAEIANKELKRDADKLTATLARKERELDRALGKPPMQVTA